MKVNFLVNLLIIISALQNPLKIYAYEEPLANLWKISNNSMLTTLLGYEKNLMMVDGLLQTLPEEEYNTSIVGTIVNVPRNKIIIDVVPNFLSTVKHNLTSTFPQYRHLFAFRPVKNSISALKETFDQIFNLAKRYRPLATTGYISIIRNYVVLDSEQKYSEQNKEFFDAVRQISRYNETVLLRISETQPSLVKANNMEIDTINTRDINLPIIAGDGLYNKNDSRTCSLGFLAKSKELKSNVFVTNGHCSKSDNALFYRRPWNLNGFHTLIGSMKIRRTAPLDVGLISIDNDEIIKLIDTSMVIKNTDSDLNKVLFVDDDAAIYSHGAHICKSGFATHVTCGSIIGFDGFFIDQERSIVFPLTISTAPQLSGDSGGAVFSYKQDLRHVSLIGIHALGDDSISGYIPIEKILKEFNLTLILSGSSSRSS